MPQLQPNENRLGPGKAPPERDDADREEGGGPPDLAGSGASPTRLAPHVIRLLAFAVDLLCVAAPLSVAALVGVLAGIASPLWIMLVLAVAFVTYASASVWLTGGKTIGKAICGLTERRIDGSAPPRTLGGLAWAIGRHSVGYLVIDVFGLGVLVALVTPRRRCLHDYAFASEVVIPSADEGLQLSSPAARLRDYEERLRIALEQTSKRYAWAFFLWKWLTKWVLFAVTALGSSKKFANWLAGALRNAPSAASAKPAKPLSAKGALGLATGTAATTAVVTATLLSAPGPIPIIGTWRVTEFVETANVQVVPVDFEGAVIRIAEVDCQNEPCRVEIKSVRGNEEAERLEGLQLRPDDGGSVYEAEWESVGKCVDSANPETVLAEGVYQSRNTLRWEPADDGHENELSFTYRRMTTLNIDVEDLPAGAEDCPEKSSLQATFTVTRVSDE
jgi:RDD family